MIEVVVDLRREGEGEGAGDHQARSGEAMVGFVGGLEQGDRGCTGDGGN